jgi:hypothetical protein
VKQWTTHSRIEYLVVIPATRGSQCWLHPSIDFLLPFLNIGFFLLFDGSLHCLVLLFLLNGLLPVNQPAVSRCQTHLQSVFIALVQSVLTLLWSSLCLFVAVLHSSPSPAAFWTMS